MRYLLFTFFLIISFGFLVVPRFKTQAAAALLDDKLVLAEGDYRVYYINDGLKHWIDSVQAFRNQGFYWEEVSIVGVSELELYEEGETILSRTNLFLPGDEEVLPDLVAFPLYDFRFDVRQGRTILRFSSTYWNQGKGPLIVTSDSNTTHKHHYEADGEHESTMRDVHTEDTDQGEHYQQIVHQDGTSRRKILGGFHWHSEHSHYHYDDFAHYVFEPVADAGMVPTRLEKATRCLWDTMAVDVSLPNAPKRRVFASCKDAISQGVSVGWGDEYDFTLADQYLDVHDMPKGIYRLLLVVDPKEKIAELRRDNNTSVAFIELDVAERYVRVLAAAGPFLQGGRNQFVDGTLISDDAGKVYVMHNNKKRLLRSDLIFDSYGFSRDSIYAFPQAVVDAMPFNNLIRANGIDIYAVNVSGYKRHIRNPGIFNSYLLSWGDVADINTTEFATHPDSRLVQVFGKPEVYYIDGDILRWVSSLNVFSINNFRSEEIHIINNEDFAAYSRGAALEGLIRHP